MANQLRISAEEWNHITADIRRPHRHAHERIGVIGCKLAYAGDSDLIFFPVTYLTLPDELYERDKKDPTVLIGSKGITYVMTFAFKTKLSCLYVHLHDHDGVPGLSGPDKFHGRNMVGDLANANAKTPHGFLVLSSNAASGIILVNGIIHAPEKITTSIVSTKLVIK